MDDIPHKDPFLEADEPFSLPHEDRFRHVFVAGKTGVGKSTFLFNTALSDIEAGHGVGFIDPHGDEADSLIASIPPTRINDVCYVNLADTAFPVAFNPVAGVPIDERPRRIAAIVSSFAHTYRADGSWGHESER